MERATLPRPQSASSFAARLAAVPAGVWAKIGFALLCLGALALYLVYPTAPTYDSMNSMVWGRELLGGQIPDVDEYRMPTQHPLWMVIGAGLSIFGESGDKLMVLVAIAGFVALIAAAYRIARVCWTPLIGWLAAIVLLTRLDFGYTAVRGFLDIPFLAFVAWAAALEAERPRRGGIVWVLLALAGLLRPEAWLLAGLYFVWLAWPASWTERLRYAVWAASAPLLWALSDVILSGDPLASTTKTNSNIESLDQGGEGLASLPGAVTHVMLGWVKLPVLVAGAIGFVLALLLAPRRSALPAVLLLTGLFTFCAVSAVGLGEMDRYMALAALAMVLFAGFLLGGAQLLRSPDWLKRVWALGAVFVVAAAAIYAVRNVELSQITYELNARAEASSSLATLLDDPRVQAGRRCGPVSVPNHKMIPEVRWDLDTGPRGVVARSDATQRARARRGVALFVTGGAKFVNLTQYGPWTFAKDSAYNQVPGPGFVRVATTPYFAAYVNC